MHDKRPMGYAARFLQRLQNAGGNPERAVRYLAAAGVQM
jgi:hypothetical protein